MHKAQCMHLSASGLARFVCSMSPTSCGAPQVKVSKTFATHLPAGPKVSLPSTPDRTLTHSSCGGAVFGQLLAFFLTALNMENVFCVRSGCFAWTAEACSVARAIARYDLPFVLPRAQLRTFVESSGLSSTLMWLGARLLRF